MMRAELGEHGGPKFRKLHPFAGKLAEPAVLRAQEPVKRAPLLVRCPTGAQIGQALRQMKLCDRIAFLLQRAQQDRKAVLDAVGAQEPRLLPADLAVATDKIVLEKPMNGIAQPRV